MTGQFSRFVFTWTDIYRGNTDRNLMCSLKPSAVSSALPSECRNDSLHCIKAEVRDTLWPTISWMSSLIYTSPDTGDMHKVTSNCSFYSYKIWYKAGRLLNSNPFTTPCITQQPTRNSWLKNTLHTSIKPHTPSTDSNVTQNQISSSSVLCDLNVLIPRYKSYLGMKNGSVMEIHFNTNLHFSNAVLVLNPDTVKSLECRWSLYTMIL